VFLFLQEEYVENTWLMMTGAECPLGVSLKGSGGCAIGSEAETEVGGATNERSLDTRSSASLTTEYWG